MQSLLRASHQLAAVHVARPLYLLSRLARPRHRAAARAAREGLRFRTAARGWTEDRKRAWVLERLRAVVRHAYDRTPYYRALLDGLGWDPRADFGFDDYARLPVLERDPLRERARDMRALPLNLLREDSTGGSSGVPTRIWRGPEELGWGESAADFFMRRIGVRPGTATGLLWGHHLDPVASDALMDRARAWMEHVRWMDCLRMSPALLERHHEALQGWRPACVVAYAGALGALAEHVLASGHTPAYPGRCFVTGAEKLLPHHREWVRQAFGRPVHERYGSRDAGLIGFQVDPERTLDYEVDWANLLVEPETDGGRASLLVTKLHADGMPMLRYRIGDIGRFPDGSRPGHPALVLHEVVGRETDRVWLPGGGWVDGLGFPHLMKDFPVREFQVVQARDLSVAVRVVPRPGFTAQVAEQIRVLVVANVAGVAVSVQAVDEIPRTRAGKWRPVLSEAEAPTARGAR